MIWVRPLEVMASRGFYYVVGYAASGALMQREARVGWGTDSAGRDSPGGSLPNGSIAFGLSGRVGGMADRGASGN